MEQIILWESNIEIIRASKLAVYKALKELKIKAILIINSEPPLIGRNQLWDRLPVIEIRGLNWTLTPGRAFKVEDLRVLFSIVFSDLLGDCKKTTLK